MLVTTGRNAIARGRTPRSDSKRGPAVVRAPIPTARRPVRPRNSAFARASTRFDSERSRDSVVRSLLASSKRVRPTESSRVSTARRVVSTASRAVAVASRPVTTVSRPDERFCRNHASRSGALEFPRELFRIRPPPDPAAAVRRDAIGHQQTRAFD